MRTRTRTILAGLVLATALVGGAAWATIPGANGTIQGCYTTGNGNLRVVDSADECRNSETAISWNQQGQKGEPGLAGPAGAKGSSGDPGLAGATGATGAQGDTGAAGAPGATGPQGLNGDTGATGAQGQTGATGLQGLKGDTGPAGPAGSGGALASLDALGGIACNAAGNPGTVVVSYGPPPVGAITLGCKPTANSVLLVAKTGAGSGTVSSNVGGIDCGTACSRTFTTGTVVTLTAAAASGDEFVGWTGGGGCSGTGTCTVTMTATGLVTVSARFEPYVPPAPTFSLYFAYAQRDATDTISVTPPSVATTCEFGSLSPLEIFCLSRFLVGTTVTLLAGNSRVVWYGACAGTTGVTCTLTLDANKEVSARFPLFPGG